MDGYVTIATGIEKYFKMAAQLAFSVKFYDPTRPIALICDDAALIPPASRSLFDQVISIEPYGHLRGTEAHLYLNRLSPYDRTVYLDSDCLISSPRFPAVWKKLQNYPVTFPGQKLFDGFWRVDISAQREKIGTDYIVQLNGGVFYFDKSAVSNTFFEYAQHLFEDRREEVTVMHKKGGGYANEPIWGASMAKLSLDIFPLTEQLNVSTLGLEDYYLFDTVPTIAFQKKKQIYNPLVTHFIGLGGHKQKNVNQLYADLFCLLIGNGAHEHGSYDALYPPQDALLTGWKAAA